MKLWGLSIVFLLGCSSTTKPAGDSGVMPGPTTVMADKGAAEGSAIVVTFNYRLGVFGYLEHSLLAAEAGKPAAPPYGLLDQRAAPARTSTILTDGFFAASARQTARQMAAHGSPAYLYQFSYPFNPPLYPNLGTAHAFELPFVFSTTLGGRNIGDDERAMSDAIMGYAVRGDGRSQRCGRSGVAEVRHGDGLEHHARCEHHDRDRAEEVGVRFLGFALIRFSIRGATRRPPFRSRQRRRG